MSHASHAIDRRVASDRHHPRIGQHYFLKSADATDVRTLRAILPDYLEHVKTHPSSLLPRYVALFLLRFAPSQEEGRARSTGARWSRRPRHLAFLCMTYAFGGVTQIERRFDLKGSTHGRRASAAERLKKAATLKDLDWISDGHTFPREGGRAVLDALHADTSFLARKGLMDYSLLVGISAEGGEEAAWRIERSPGLVVLPSAGRRLYLALIDVLTPYGARKAAETLVLGTLRFGADISCQPPRKYAHRFMTWLERHAMPPDSGAPSAGEAGAGNAAADSAGGARAEGGANDEARDRHDAV